MIELINILQNYNLKTAYEIEENDRQFLAIQKITKTKMGIPILTSLVITNSLLCYQLSSKGEDYWEEFADYINSNKAKINTSWSIKLIFEDFLPKSKWNKRLLNLKIKRIDKIELLLQKISWKEEYFYNNFMELQEILTKIMKQNKNDKTILFTLKMFHYLGRIIFDFRKEIPYEIWIPLDSRVMKIEKIYNKEKIDSQTFWNNISLEIRIPCIHLDAILWVKCDDFICRVD